ncbi:ADP-ribosylation factor GTPase-activating protein 2-like isoform X2 [Liolophura sinensis]|uniref:ADP-ribosylation factor GTPase-activating protein 2-like isoform X2 n=1 Tax=Liolophura sinensis TaxID=3198878 RepID=UPI003158F9FA
MFTSPKMADHPSKHDITAIFKRLRSIPTNKQCFDCGSSNPTWASITYGVFLCIDCSAVHRSLGVHVTFIRSTQLDTNWTWLQLRAMQVGGNANATAFFRQHGCTSSDSQQKYHSRAASLYRDKLHHLATQAMRLHGTQVNIDAILPESPPPAKDVDFFKEHAESTFQSEMISDTARLVISDPQPIKNGSLSKTETAVDPNEGPSVEAALSMSPTQAQAQAEPRKTTIGARRPVGAKKGKGLGAQRVKTNFSEIESQAQEHDKHKEALAAAEIQQMAQTKEEEEKRQASMRLAYKDMGAERKKQEEKLKVSDPKKAAQMERLGMGFTGSREISHSAVSDMQTIEQQTPSGREPSRYDNSYRERQSSRNRDFFDDEFEMIGGFSSGPPRYNDGPFSSNKRDDYGSWSGKSNSSWDMDRFDSKQSSYSETISSKDDDRQSRSRKTYSETSTSEDAQKKFGNAKAISSAAYFGNSDPDFETKQNLSKFEGSTGISSSDFFGNGAERGRSGDYGSGGPDLAEIKEGVKQGVTKVAGKLSSLANGMMNSLQDRYGS